MSADPWAPLRSRTPARIGLGHAGPGLPTSAHLAFQAAHAAARDAVHAGLDLDGVEAALAAWAPVLRIASLAADRLLYLQRPDLGRRLAPASAAALADPAKGADLMILVGDGLSARAVTRHAPALLAALVERLPGWRLAPILLATGARVALGDAAAALLEPTLVLVLIGERPGLSSPDSLGAYLTFRPSAATTDADRNCVSNIHGAGLDCRVAADRIAWLLSEARSRRLTGVALKLDSAPVLAAPAWSCTASERNTAMKLSARNQIKGKVVEVHKGQTTAHVRIDIGNGVVITASITNEAIDDLNLAVGDEALAVIKASDVMVAK
jgi:ethanolamine ammonia-lyase small subunit